jgi:hypothetical protein
MRENAEREKGKEEGKNKKTFHTN